MDSKELDEFAADVRRLLALLEKRPGRPPGRTDRASSRLRDRIRRLYASGQFKTKVAIARFLGVSRWTVARAIGCSKKTPTSRGVGRGRALEIPG